MSMTYRTASQIARRTGITMTMTSALDTAKELRREELRAKEAGIVRTHFKKAA